MRFAVVLLALALPSCLKFNRKALVNHPPTAVAVASPADRVGPRAIVSLDASGSTDPENQTLAFKWTQLSGDLVWAGAQKDAVTSFVAPERPQTLLFAVEVSDSKWVSEPVLVRIEVETNSAPVAAAVLHGPAIAGTTIGVDGRSSSDAEGSQLGYKWRCLSHPDLLFAPSDTDPAPTLTVPNHAGETLRLGLVVSDGRLVSDEVQVEATIEPGDTTHWFVDSAATCVSCDGSRARPFQTIALAVAASAVTARPILVAGGYYGSLALTESAHLTGGCDPGGGWACGVASKPSLLSGADDETVTLTVSGPTTIAVVRHVSIIGPFGLTAAGGGSFKSAAVRVTQADLTLDHVYAEAHGVGPNVEMAVTLDVVGTAHVRLFDSTLLGGRALYNVVADLNNVTDVWIDHSVLRSKPDARNGFLAPTLTDNIGLNEVVHTHGGGNYTITRSQLIGEAADDQLQTLVELAATTGLTEPEVMVANSLLWHKGNGSGLTFVGPDATTGQRRYRRNTLTRIQSGGHFTFLNDTFLGNDAVWDPTSALCLQRGATGCGCPAGFDAQADCGCAASPPPTNPARFACGGLHGFFMESLASVAVTNCYFQKIHMVGYSQSAARRVTFRHNTFFEVVKYDGGDDVEPSLSLAGLADGYQDPNSSQFGMASQAGEANLAEDCLLQDPDTGNAHLGAGSPCIDSGTLDPSLLSSDLDRQPLPVGAAPDRGAYEVQP